MSTRMDYADWKAPKTDEASLIWPPAEDWPRMASANAAAMSTADASVQGVPIGSLRSEMRGFVGIGEEQLAFVTGHQAELWHPGVWAKNALIDAAARSVTNGVAMHVTVDTDAPKHLDVRWPGERVPVTDDPALATAAWTGLVEPPTPAHLAAIAGDLGRSVQAFGYDPMLGEWIGHLRATMFEGSSGSDLPKAIAAAGHRLDWSLGLDYAIHTLSPWLNSRPWLAFVYHVLARAPAFTTSYNMAVQGYREQAGIASNTRPVPDLAVDGDRVEVPFWLDEIGPMPRRHRATVERRGDTLVLRSPGSDEVLVLDPALPVDVATDQLRKFLSDQQLRIGPRALTLTMFMRLFVADVFVHGIGGGRYDQITDRLIRDHFGIEPPRFGVTTATMYLPQAMRRERACVPCVVHEGHRLKHALLGERKRELVAAIDAAPRRSAERAALFLTMHRELREAAVSDGRVEGWRRTLDEMRQREADDATVFDREVFYAMQPRERLTAMIDQYRAAFTLSGLRSMA